MFEISIEGKFHVTASAAIAFRRMAQVIGVSENELEDYLRLLWRKKLYEKGRVIKK